MDAGRQSEKSLDTSNISAELLLLTLEACRAGLFYSPMSAGESNVANFSHRHAPNQAWSLNIGPLFGLAESPADSAELLPYIVESDRGVLMQCIMKAIGEDVRESDCEYRILRPDGEIRWLMSRVLVGVNDHGETRYLASMCFDITEQKAAQEGLERSNAQLEQAQKYLRAALSASRIAIFRHVLSKENAPASTDYESWNFNLPQLYGYSADAVLTPELQLRHMRQEDLDIIRSKAYAAINANQREFQHEYPIVWDDQSTHWLLSKCTTDLNASGEPEYVSGAVIDITDRKLAEERMQFIATHDVLTALPNRFMFSNLLNHTIEAAKRYSNRFALFFIDLDRFKAVNDALGHQAGDQLLIDVAHRLRKYLRTSDVLARISGDEFVLLAPEIDSEESAGVIARKLIAEISQPMVLLGQKCQVTASVGICLYPEHGDDELMLMKHADSAMYVAKEAGKNNYQFYNASSTSQSLERMSLENELRSALVNNELSLQYQAKVDLRTDSITGVEALLRWNSPKFGNVSPVQFIPIAEEIGLIVPIGRWVLMKACQQNVEWQKQGLPPICVAVNLSARQFMDKNLLEDIKEALAVSGMAPGLLELEITESMVMHRVEEAVALLYSIKQLGARIAIDDFGTGYSSLAQLKRFPIDTLKVDRSFIREVAHDLDDQAITDAVIALGKSLSLTIIAEGVETKEQQDFLRNHSCDEMQGYYFSRPVEAADFSELLRKNSKTVR